jgi:hypothetical protein
MLGDETYFPPLKEDVGGSFSQDHTGMNFLGKANFSASNSFITLGRVPAIHHTFASGTA